MKNFITLTLFITFTLSTVEAHNVAPYYPSDKKEVKIENIVIKRVTYAIKTVTISLLQECTVTITSEAKLDEDSLVASASATEKNCRKARRKANRELRRLLR